MTLIHLVDHTHWDREWYFTTSDSLVLSDDIFTNVLNALELNSTMKFTLDGQSSIIDDYLEIRPEKIQLVKKLVKNGQLKIGPWYTQTDAFYVDTESIIKNLIIGIRESKKYGDYMKVGYLPDTFGLNQDMPTILLNAGIDNIVFWRGIEFGEHVNSPYFIWSSKNNKNVYAVNLVNGYGDLSKFKDDRLYYKEEIIPKIKKMIECTKSDDILVTIGGDQMDVVSNFDDLPEILESISDFDFKISDYETFINTIRDNSSLEIYQGEFRRPQKSRVHKSIGSVRYDIKRENFLLEQKLLKRVEPLMAISFFHGIDISKEIVIKAWKNLLEGHAHDSMGGCVTDNVAIDIIHRFKESRELAEGLENLILFRLAEKLDLDSNDVMIFNTHFEKYEGLYEIEILSKDKNIDIEGMKYAVITQERYYPGKDNLLIETPNGNKYINEKPYYKLKISGIVQIPSMGYKILKIKEKKNELDYIKKSEDNFIENDIYKISYVNNNIRLELKSNGLVVENFIVFEDQGNDGDTYDFSPLRGEKPIEIAPNSATIHKSRNSQVINVKFKEMLPLNLDERLKENPQLVEYIIDCCITLDQNSDLIKFKSNIDNNVLSHRIRAKINTGILSDISIASTPLGFIKRKILNLRDVDWIDGYEEYPIDIEPFDKSVSIESNELCLSAFSKGMKEYQVIDDKLYLTLMSTTGQLGKPNLLYRPGRASGDTTKKGHVMIGTPMAELQKELEFEFAIYFKDERFDEGTATQLWEVYTRQYISYQRQTLNKFINRLDNKIQPRNNRLLNNGEFSLFEINSESSFGSFAPSLYEDSSYILRMQNHTGDFVPVRNFNSEYLTINEVVNYNEERINDSLEFVGPYDTLTLKLKSRKQ